MDAGLPATLLSITVLAALALTGGGLWLLIKARDPRKALLMLLAALVLFGNVAIWTV